jgi:dolichol-phosphate mannosyltransferase
VVSVVLPTYNEREGIADLIAEILAVARRAGLGLEVLVVDDASPDGTAAHVAAVFGADPAVRVHVEEFDVVIGSRYVLGGGMLTSRFRYWGSYAFNILIRIVLGLRIHDNLSGFLAFRPALLRGLDPEAVFYGYGDYAIRLLHHVVRRGGRVLEIPTVYRFRKGGESKTRFFAYFWTYLASVFRLRLARR